MIVLKRDCVAIGPKISDEDAAYGIALSIEANIDKYYRIGVAMIDDLEKGFGKVAHDIIRIKAEV